ncbi:12-alpha,13-alpha-dihydroxyfumitremorgin C prenyltransferase [Aspergillus egyptiacus]|nr:12-alpha,13-alpha-dihydroxyfumitremorgin C prenyltransferase [Aspergillus egyptiacus]
MTAASDFDSEESLQTLDRFSWFPNDHQRRWWEHTGPKLLKLLRDAQYPQKQQLAYLYLLQQRLVPYLGTFPVDTPESQRWWSNITTYGVPFELSWNLLHNIVRIGFEALPSPSTEECVDPFNKTTTHECLSQLACLDETIDLARFRHFQQELVLTADEETRLLQGQDKTPLPRTGRGQHALAVEFQKNGGLSAKAYFFPGMKSLATGIAPGKLILDAIKKLDLQGLKEPVRHLQDFLGINDDDDGNPADKAVAPFLFGCDLCDPNRSRLKFYVTDQIVSWDRVADMWTLRGARLEDPQCSLGLTLLRKLWDLLRIPEGHRSNVRPEYPLGTPLPSDYRAVMMANWTLSHTKRFPDPQIYFLTVGMNDAVVMDALVTFYEAVGRTDLARTYRDKVASYYPELDLTKTNYVHSGVSFSYRRSKPYVTVYYSPF